MTNNKTVLITGATGTIGKLLIPLLYKNGYTIHVLSRRNIEIQNAKVFLWDVNEMKADSAAFQNINYIIHLAGEGIADKRWTEVRKQQIIDSRVNSVKLLNKCVTDNKLKLEKFVSASAVGYYGADASDKFYNEDDVAGNDFLADCCKKWEAASDTFLNNCPVVKIRLGVVLDRNSGAFPKLILPIKYGVASALGSGNQPLPWIHVNDVCNVFLSALVNDEMIGIYNAVSTDYQTNKSFTSIAAKVIQRPYFLPNVPAFILRIAFGELSDTFLKGQKVYPQRLINKQFSFEFETLESAIKDLTK